MSLERKGWASLVLVVVTLSLVEQCLCGYPQAPTCAKLECPSYVVIDSQTDFEIRNYTDHLWVYTRYPITAANYQEAYSKGFNIISSYINGANEQKMKIDMTAPLLTNVYPFSPASSYQVYFSVPQKFQFVPKPDADDIYKTTLPEGRYVAVRRFSNLIEDNSISTELSALKDSLKGTPWEAAAAAQNHTVASYNLPTETDNLVNEVLLWFYN